MWRIREIKIYPVQTKIERNWWGTFILPSDAFQTPGLCLQGQAAPVTLLQAQVGSAQPCPALAAATLLLSPDASETRHLLLLCRTGEGNG